MNFIDDHHFAGHSQVAEHQVLLLQSSHQQLIHRANDEVRQQRLFVPLKPGVYRNPFIGAPFLNKRSSRKKLPVVLVQFRHTVGQLDGMGGVFRLGLRPGGQPSKDTVGGGLGGQSEEKTACPPLCGKGFRRSQGGLCFAHAHLGL